MSQKQSFSPRKFFGGVTSATAVAVAAPQLVPSRVVFGVRAHFVLQQDFWN